MTWYVVEVEQTSTKVYVVNAPNENVAQEKWETDGLEQDEFIEKSEVLSVRIEDDRWDDDRLQQDRDGFYV